VELYVEIRDTSVGIPTIGIERLNPLEVHIEPRTIEVVLFSPWDDRALASGQGGFESRLVHTLDPHDCNLFDSDCASSFTGNGSGERGKQRDDGKNMRFASHVLELTTRRAM